MDADPYLAVIAVLLIVISAVVSVARQEITSLLSGKVRLWEDDKRQRYRRLFALMQEPEKLIATVRITGLLADVLTVAIVAHWTSLIVVEGGMYTVVILLVVFCISLRLLIVHLLRKHASGKILPALSLPIAALKVVFYPLIIAILWTSRAFRKKQDITIEELSNVLEKTPEASENENILKGIAKLGNIDVHTIMTSRMDVESVDVSLCLSELIDKINEWGYSRIPVYEDTPDIVKGILYVKDLLPFIAAPDDFRWQKLVRKAYFVPENKKIDQLLKEFQAMKTHLAVIINEYGSMVGIVTLEDILEEIVGDIADESDDDEQDYIKVDDSTYLFDGKVLLNDFFRIMQLEASDFASIRGEADTLAGVILEIKGEIPQKGDCVEYMHLEFCVEAVDNRRIKQIKVIVHER